MAENIVHLVLARTPDAPPGHQGHLAASSCPSSCVDDDGSLGERNDVTCVSIEHKMGIKASPTCVLAYGENGDGAVGYLIGEENQGMRYMFTMMNNARLSVGLEGLALAERAYQQAARLRPGAPAGPGRRARPRASRPPIIEHPDVRRMLLTMKALIEAMRGLIYLNAEAIDLVAAPPRRGRARARSQELADLLTPVVKALGHRHGRRGHLARHPGPRRHGLHRGDRASPSTSATPASPPIYEGTNGIQAMDLVGRKLPMRGGGVVADFLAGIAAARRRARPSRRRRPRRRPRAAWPTALAAWSETTELAPRARPRRPARRPGRCHALPAAVQPASPAAGCSAEAGARPPGRPRRRRAATPSILEAKVVTPASSPRTCCPPSLGLARAGHRRLRRRSTP